MRRHNRICIGFIEGIYLDCPGDLEESDTCNNFVINFAFEKFTSKQNLLLRLVIVCVLLEHRCFAVHISKFLLRFNPIPI